MTQASESVVIVAAARTPIGAFNGTLANVDATHLGTTAMKAVLQRAAVAAQEIDEAIIGQILTAGAGQNPARQTALNAGMSKESTAWGLNQVCGSGLRAVALGLQQIKNNDARIIIAGGQESMSRAPHCSHLRDGVRMGDCQMIDTMIKDGLWDAFNGYHMGVTAENVAKHWQIDRDLQDQFALASQNKAEKAQEAGKFAEEITPVTIITRKAEVQFAHDEYIKKGVTLDSLSKLRPAFDKDGTVTAGNASGINDGAALVLLMSETEAKNRKIEPLARIVSWATTGVDPALMGSGPIPASQAALKKAGWSAQDLDLIEANEAFAAQACAVNKAMGWDLTRVNVNGGAIALGHPIGASGARILVTLLYEMKRRHAHKALATLCIGGGMGIAMCFARD